MKKFTTLKMRNRKISKNLVLGLLMSMGSLLSFAQTVTTSVATGTTTTTSLPIFGAWGYSYSQQIYLASDFNPVMAGQPSNITKIRFFNVSGSLTDANSWNIYLGNTAATSFGSTTSWIPMANLTQVFSGTLTAPAANSWLEITLSTPFTWDGVSNLVVAIDENTPNFTAITWRSHATGANRSMLYRNDTNNPDPNTPPTANSRFSYVPQAQFVHEPTGPCSGTPAHANAAASVTSICSNAQVPVNLSLTGLPFLSGYTYQWEYNNGSGWQTFANSDTSIYTANPTATMNIRAQVTCDNSGLSDISEETTVTFNTAPTLSLNETSLAYCAGSPATVIASGTNTYAWTPATGLNVANNDTVVASPVNATTYTLIGTDLVGCKDTATVFVTPVSKIQKSAAYTPTTLCTPGTPVTVTASASPATIFGGGAYEYRFIDANGAELQAWNTTNTYNFVPATDSIYKVYVDFRSTTCPDAIDSVLTSVVVGFGANTAIVDYDCINLGGTVTLSSIFGQENVETVYTNPFADPVNDIANITFNGSAAITGGRALLTPSATSINGSVTINDPAFHTGLNNAMTVSFKMTADQPINNFGTGGADGISYSFGDDVSVTGNQNGSGSKLRLSFDANDNSPNMGGIYLAYNLSGTMSPGNAATIIYNNNLSLWKIKQDAQVVLTINTLGKASLTIDGTTVFENIQMPAAYMNANTTGWKHVFGAATGGDAMRQAISNVVITAPSLDFALVDENTTPTTWQGSGVFTNIQPGTYDVWISSNGSASCAKKIETVEIVNTNPLVLLGNDTTICEGESLVLDAGNAGSSYVWSNSQITTQTRTVTQAGSYVVNVTAPNGCVGVGSINVDVMGAPTASTIYVVNNMPTYTFTILNPQNANQYSWDFGDGTTIANAPGTVTHTYLTAGPKMVSVTLTNECGTETVIATIVVTSTAGIEENEIEGLSVYPNPASDKVTIVIPETATASAAVYSATGTLVTSVEKLSAQTELAVEEWTPGVYFVRVQSESKTSTIKLVIQ